jgi:mono/diheme cytochrome c family protein
LEVTLRVAAILIVALAARATPAVAGSAAQTASSPSGAALYNAACAACHGTDGRGSTPTLLGFDTPIPDFTDCSFSTVEPDADWMAVSHDGGPARGFDRRMPAFGDALTSAQIDDILAYVRTMCASRGWPRGELNLPRPLVTAKAFPEDEAVVSTTAQSGSSVTKVIYERRFGPLNQVEVILPIASEEGSDDHRATGVGDIALEYKRTLTHSLARGNIVSVTGELVLPTGSEAKGLGGGTAVFEPFLTFGQLLPRNSFLQAQAGFGIPLENGHDNEVFWRVAVGGTFEQNPFGRLWTPMLEVLAARPLVSGAAIEWDLLPGAQVTLNTRQHIRLAGGVRLPVTESNQRRKSVIVYLLWDWYEGGFFQGW